MFGAGRIHYEVADRVRGLGPGGIDAMHLLAQRTGLIEAIDRGNQENLIEQLKNGARAMRMPVDNVVSNWAYMVMASLAWSLKAWFGLLLREEGRWQEKHRQEKTAVLWMEFKRFVNALVRVPCQLLKTGRRLVYRPLAWNPWNAVFLVAWTH